MASFAYKYFLDHIAKRLENNDYFFERNENKLVFYIGCPCKQEEQAVAYLAVNVFQEDDQFIKATFCLTTHPDKTFINTSLNKELYKIVTEINSKYARLEKIIFKIYLK